MDLIELHNESTTEEAPVLSPEQIENEAIIFLRFVQSYIGGKKMSVDPEMAAEIYREKQITGAFDKDLAAKFNSTKHIVWFARNAFQSAQERVQRIFGEHQHSDAQPTDNQRIEEIYEAYRRLPAYFAREIDQKTELGILLARNPDVLELFIYLSEGNSLQSYAKQHSLTGFSSTVLFRQGLELANLVAYSIPAGRNPHKYIAAKAFTELLNQDDPISIRMKLSLNISRIFHYRSKLSGKIHDSISEIKRALELSMLLHYYIAKSEPRSERNYPLFSNIDNPYLIDPLAYYRDCSCDKIPGGIRILLEAYLNRKIPSSFYKPLSDAGIPYKSKTLGNYVNHGIIFLENVLMNRANRTLTYEELTANRRQETKRILDLMAERNKNG